MNYRRLVTMQGAQPVHYLVYDIQRRNLIHFFIGLLQLLQMSMQGFSFHQFAYDMKDAVLFYKVEHPDQVAVIDTYACGLPFAFNGAYVGGNFFVQYFDGYRAAVIGVIAFKHYTHTALSEPASGILGIKRISSVCTL